MFEEYLNKITSKHDIEAAEWIKETILNSYGPTSRKMILKSEDPEYLLSLGIKVGVRRDVPGTGEIVTIYKKGEVIDRKNFKLKDNEEDEE